MIKSIHKLCDPNVCLCAGVWLKSSLGYVQREGDHLILTYIAPQLGYWVAAMSPVHTGEPSMSPVHTGEPSSALLTLYPAQGKSEIKALNVKRRHMLNAWHLKCVCVF